jgi:hypothetical protein
LGCFGRFWGANPALFLIFWRNVTPPRGRWGFGDHSSFVERQRSGDAPLVARTQQRLVRLLVTHLSLKIYGNTQRLFAYNIQ